MAEKYSFRDPVMAIQYTGTAQSYREAQCFMNVEALEFNEKNELCIPTHVCPGDYLVKVPLTGTVAKFDEKTFNKLFEREHDCSTKN